MSTPDPHNSTTFARNILTDKRAVFALALFACLLWGSAFPAVKVGYALFQIGVDDLPGKLLFAGYRFMLAGLLLLGFSLFLGKKPFSLHMQDFCRLSLLGFFMTTLQYAFFYISLSHMTGVKGSILNGTITFFYVLLAHFALKGERLNRYTITGCLIGFGGVVSVNFNGASLDTHFTLYGEGFMLLSAFAHALAGIYGKFISQDMDSMVMTAWQLGIGGFILIIFGYALGGTLTHFTLPSVSLLLYMSLLSSVAFTIMAALLKHNPVSMVTVFQFTCPLFGACLSALFLGEKLLEWKNLVALILVCMGIFIVTHINGSRRQ